MNFLPLWTASVWPTNSGGIVERRDHVFSTFFCRLRFSSSTRVSSVSSMYGPFLSERPHAVDRHHPHLARRQLERRPLALLRQELRLRAGAPAHLRAAARLELHVVNERADRDIAERQRVARQDVGLRSRHDGVAHFEAERRDDVALLAVTVVEQCEPCGAIGIILDPRHARRDAELLTPEVHRAEHALRPAAAVAHGDPPVRIAPARPPLGREQALLRLLPGDFLGRDVREVPAGRRGRLDGADAHDRSGTLDQLDLVARLERHNRLLPVPPSALKASHPLELPLERRGPDRRDLDVEHRLDGGADLDRKSTRLNSSHGYISYAVFCLKKKKI